MTREERVEEMLYHARERGYYDQVLQKYKEIKILEPRIDLYECWDKAYYEAKSENYESSTS